jgi:hypothetical protein
MIVKVGRYSRRGGAASSSCAQAESAQSTSADPPS